MVEPPVPGFTGVVWEARPTEQLARDLTTGRGAVPMADAASAWARLAASFGGAVAEYDQIIRAIDDAWRSEASGPVVERITKLREWLVDAASAAGQNAARAGVQVTAYEVARLTMPHIAEIAALEAAKKSVEQIGAGLGAPLVGAAAEIDAEQDTTKATAARVMRGYESATSPLATAWQQAHPPVIASSAALEAEQAATQSSAAAPPRPGMVPASFAGRMARVAMPRAPHAYRAPVIAQAAPEPTVVPGQSSAAAESASSRMMPTGMAPASAMAEAQSTVRAAAAARLGEGLEIEAGIDAAPAVLGGRAEPAPHTTATGQAP
ncbi:PPE domain-containing protein [Nocardia lijiangensis]|uniref:PPE domain-containing protein n=1 Tax=Nocardia lijiangensis TaxID=299618 RepID=UPI003D7349FB